MPRKQSSYVTAEGVLTLLNKLVRDSSHTMLIATHSQQVAALCDRVIELHSGRLEEATSQPK